MAAPDPLPILAPGRFGRTSLAPPRRVAAHSNSGDSTMFASAPGTPGTPGTHPLRRFAAAAAIALGLAAPLAFDAAAREFEPGDDHGQTFEAGDDHGRTFEIGDDHGGLVATTPVWSAPAWPTTDDHGGWFHD